MAALGLQTVTDREELVEALNGPQSSWNPGHPVIIAAARERLTQLPETCERCNGAGYADDGSGRTDRAEGSCRGCYGFGKVYPDETVTRITEALHDYQWRPNIKAAIAVLEALNSTADPSRRGTPLPLTDTTSTHAAGTTT